MTGQRRVLVVDIGNTSVTLGIFEAGEIRKHTRTKSERRPLTEVKSLVKRFVSQKKPIDGAIVASVVPELTNLWIKGIRTAFREIHVLQFSYKLDLGLAVTYPRPETIGADRLVDAVAAAHEYSTPAIVVDFGTATTFDLILPEMGFVGGVITPGVSVMMDYLADKTAQLPHIKNFPKDSGNNILGRSTFEAMTAGARYGYLGLVKEIVQRLQASVPADIRGETVIVLTGGYVGLWADELKNLGRVIVDQNLTLLGLGFVFERNS